MPLSITYTLTLIRLSVSGMQRVFRGVLQRHVQRVSIRRLPTAHRPRREGKGTQRKTKDGRELQLELQRREGNNEWKKL